MTEQTIWVFATGFAIFIFGKGISRLYQFWNDYQNRKTSNRIAETLEQIAEQNEKHILILEKYIYIIEKHHK